MDGKKPTDEKMLGRISAEVRRLIYTAIRETKNLVSITDVHGKDIEEDIDLFKENFGRKFRVRPREEEIKVF